MLPEKEEFCFHVSSDMHPGRDLFDTLSDIIPVGKTIHLTSLQAVCDPMKSEDGEPNRLKAELFWLDAFDGEIVHYPIDIAYTECSFYKEYPEGLGSCLNGVKFIGTGTGRFVIRRHVEGRIGPQHTHVIVRGHIH
jgi:hypothetical protein